MKMLKITAALLAIVMLASCGAAPKAPNESEVTKSTAVQELMSADDIMNIAIEHAKSSAEGAVAEELANGTVSDKECEFTAKNGIPIYDCKFKIGILEFEYEVDQQNGAIRTYARGFDVDAPGRAGAPRIGEDAALSYALWYLDLKEADISDASSVFDNDFYDYFVRFSVGDDVYTCVIDPYDGVFGRSTRDIGYNGAKEIAYNHAAQNIAEDQQEDFNNLMLGGLMSDCTTKAKGVASERTYEVKFSIGGFKYEYVIDGLSGNILKVGCEPDDKWKGEHVGGFDAATVSLAKPDIPDYFAEVEKTADTGDDGFIGEIAAIDIASGYARFNGFGIYDPVATLQNGEYYDVIFFTSRRELMHNSYIDALTGDILYSVVERKDFSVLPDFDLGEVTDDAGFIGEKLAVELAVEYAGHTTDDAFDIEVELKYSRGIEAYEVRYAAGEYEYEYTLKAEDGDVLRAVHKPAEKQTVEG